MEDIPKPSSPWGPDAIGDGPVTISDLGAWVQDAFFIPGDWSIWTIATYTSPVAEFLEIGAGDYGGVLSGFLSLLAWLLLILAAGLAYGGVRELDRRLTDAAARAWAELKRRFRVACVLLGYRVRRAVGEERKPEAIELSEDVKLGADELRVLRLHSQVEAGYALPMSELSTTLKIPLDRVRQLLGRLKDLNLVSATIGGEGESAYRLTRAGQAFLVFRQLAPSGEKR